ncbi:MAG TPA: hypothetical protein VNN62_20445 [Methylomirabilota bacterium]|nr:hypothetical protein [Methylomirabilota bacterium]
MRDDIKIIVEFCRTKLDLANAKLPDEYRYPHLPLCVIDAVFSIGVNYVSTKNTVDRFCQHVGISKTSKIYPPDIVEQFSIAELIELYNRYGVEGMAKIVYQNLQRTSTRNGILKSEAVLRFSETLLQFGVNYLQDVNKIVGDPNFESAITKIPGQRSGLSLRYFYMLVGSEEYVKPDRMIIRFIRSIIGKSPSIEEAHDIIVGTCEILKKEHPHLTPRLLDHLIWKYQREKEQKGTG